MPLSCFYLIKKDSKRIKISKHLSKHSMWLRQHFQNENMENQSEQMFGEFIDLVAPLNYIHK
ncbi:CLUMA_CG005145, isoform A [Clunio marinus]|uniref:CLUMA_CG005145, isoform A n=1 Tax=Clunio marinus TaxID=568069 RepID=A0A1J1HY67_9DIPT|nr:CLUMA_CG005145, isoform A [Clunio marinus]